MPSDRKILITGLTGQIGHPVAVFLARDNEVWGVARYSADGSRERAEAIGVHPHVADLETGDYGDLPTDFTHLVHFAAWQGPTPDFDRAMRANAEATGLLMAHCRHAAAAPIASTTPVQRASTHERAPPAYVSGTSTVQPVGPQLVPSNPLSVCVLGFKFECEVRGSWARHGFMPRDFPNRSRLNSILSPPR